MLKQCLLASAIILLLETTAWANIWKAAENGDVQTVLKEIADGADVNARDEHQWMPLHLATEAGNAEMVRLLIAKGADVNARGWNDETPLHRAVFWGESRHDRSAFSQWRGRERERLPGQDAADLRWELPHSRRREIASCRGRERERERQVRLDTAP